MMVKELLIGSQVRIADGFWALHERALKHHAVEKDTAYQITEIKLLPVNRHEDLGRFQYGILVNGVTLKFTSSELQQVSA